MNENNAPKRKHLPSIPSVLAHIFLNNWPMKLAALVFAFIIWSYVMVDSDPVRLMYVDNVTVSVVGADQLEAKYLTVTDDLGEIVSSVRAGIDAAQSLHKRINTDNVKAEIDLSSINAAGEASVKITVTSTFGTVRSVEPSTVSMNVDELISRQVPVTAQVIGEPSADYYVAAPTVSPTVVTVKGARSAIENVAEAKVYVDVSSLTSSLRETRSIVLFDSNNAQVTDGVTGGLPSVIVSAEVYPKKTFTLTEKALIAAVRGVPEGYEVTGAEATPSEIAVAGPKDALDELTSLPIAPINVSGATSSTLMTAEIDLADGLVAVNGNTTEVYIQISEIRAERQFKNVPIEVINDGTHKVTVAPRRTHVTVTGPASKVSALTAESLRLYVDVSSLQTGSYVLPVSFDSLEGISNSSIKLDDATVNVTVN